jgi:predicted negative regulator of RcsB-dependent stress response
MKRFLKKNWGKILVVGIIAIGAAKYFSLSNREKRQLERAID